MLKSKIWIVPAAILGIITLASLILFFLIGNRSYEKILYFPNIVTREIEGEIREIPKKKEFSKEISTFLEEIILGPADIRLGGLVSVDTEVNAVFYDKKSKRLNVDLSQDMVFDEDYIGLSTADQLDVIRYALEMNFPEIRDIVITVHGQVPKVNSAEVNN